VGGWILSDVILSSLYGVAFAKGSTALVILLLVQVVNVFMFLQTMSLNALDRPKDAFKVTAIASVINIGLDVTLIPLFGIEGAALATLATMIINSLLAYRALSRTIHVRVEWGSLRNIGVAVMGMALAVIVLRALVPVTGIFTLAGIVIVGGVVYSLLLLRLDKSIKEDIQTILAQLGISVPRIG
ncbi:MAG: polysaccharide biosynthesis C-terminal domain-containing protein, partial [Methanomicrobiaceae archaeon]|nr:polysaccharide biosynthesis C-terminal domain-containing protein [Methanomicrobiaceae archaeon]